MTAAPLSPIERATGAAFGPLQVLAAVFAAAGAISLIFKISSPHGPIMAVIGMHAPLMCAVWIATGTSHGYGKAGIDVSFRMLWCILLYVSICACIMLTLGVAHRLTRGSEFAAMAGA